MTSISFEVPRRAAPGYITAILGDHHTLRSREHWKDLPPGHRFQLYFHGMSAKGSVQCPDGDRDLKRQLKGAAEDADWDTLRGRNPNIPPGDGWAPLKNQKRVACQASAGMGKAASDLLSAIVARADALRGPDDWSREAELISPLATGLGNPHPVENGFAFLPPYGVPYLAGSGVKGVLRRAAEELALFDGESPWTLAHVWALFGFDENSSFFPKKDKAPDPGWRQAYDDWCNQVTRNGCAPLDEWVKAIRSQLPKEQREIEHAALLTALPKDQKLRRAIHWQGLLAVQDAFPDAQATMAVDILNPHHKSYYEGKIENDRHATPHDAENPVPVFFLTVAPGARFTFCARPLPGREALWRAVGDWKALLDTAFAHAFDWLGFGAKTAVGYGAMERGEAREELPPEIVQKEPEPTLETWEGAHLSWKPGRGELHAKVEGKPVAICRGEAAQRLLEKLSEDRRATLVKKGLGGIQVSVRPIGNGYELADFLLS